MILERANKLKVWVISLLELFCGAFEPVDFPCGIPTVEVHETLAEDEGLVFTLIVGDDCFGVAGDFGANVGEVCVRDGTVDERLVIAAWARSKLTHLSTSGVRFPSNRPFVTNDIVESGGEVGKVEVLWGIYQTSFSRYSYISPSELRTHLPGRNPIRSLFGQVVLLSSRNIVSNDKVDIFRVLFMQSVGVI